MKRLAGLAALKYSLASQVHPATYLWTKILYRDNFKVPLALLYLDDVITITKNYQTHACCKNVMVINKMTISADNKPSLCLKFEIKITTLCSLDHVN